MQIFRGYALRNKLVQQGLEGRGAQSFFREQPGLEAVGALNMVDRLVPRPLLLMVGDQDPFMPLEASEELYGKAKAVYARRGYPTEDRVGLFISEGEGHSFNKPMQRAALDWFIRWLVDPAKPPRRLNLRIWSQIFQNHPDISNMQINLIKKAPDDSVEVLGIAVIVLEAYMV